MTEFLTRSIPDTTQRRCYDCRHLRGAISLWCISPEARRARGTAIPGVRECSYWMPMRRAAEVSRLARWFGGYVVVE